MTLVLFYSTVFFLCLIVNLCDCLYPAYQTIINVYICICNMYVLSVVVLSVFLSAYVTSRFSEPLLWTCCWFIILRSRTLLYHCYSTDVKPVFRVFSELWGMPHNDRQKSHFCTQYRTLSVQIRMDVAEDGVCMIYNLSHNVALFTMQSQWNCVYIVSSAQPLLAGHCEVCPSTACSSSLKTKSAKWS